MVATGLTSEALRIDRPEHLQAAVPPERRGLARDRVRLMVTEGKRITHARFLELGRFLREGDLLVVNCSAMVPASYVVEGPGGPVRLNLSARFGRGLWLTELREEVGKPGPLPLEAGEVLRLGGAQLTLLAPYPQNPKLWLVRLEGDLEPENAEPIRYGYVQRAFPLSDYNTIFGRVPGSTEMPSASRPFTPRVLNDLARRGVAIASLLLHTGVSSQEIEAPLIERHQLLPEPYCVPSETAAAVNLARAEGRRVIAVGTTVVKALESAWEEDQVAPRRGFTRHFIRPGREVHSIDGLITGLHDSMTSHLALLYAIFGESLIRTAYEQAKREGYLWHEFGDVHLIFR